MEDVVIRLVADVTDLQSDLNKVKAAMLGVDNSVNKLDKDVDKAFDGKKAAQFNATTQKTEQNLKRVGTAAVSAGSTIERKLSGAFRRLAGTIAAAFSIAAVKNFMQASIAEFAKQERANAALLRALNDRADIQKRLLEQASMLQETTNIPDDVIVGAQAFLAQQGRTEEQIKKTVEAALQLSVVMGTDLQTAVMQLNGTYEGQVGRLGKLDSAVGKFTKSELAAGAAVQLFAEKYKGVAEGLAQTDAGKIQSIGVAFDELKESLGARWQKDIASSSGVLKRFIRDIKDFVDVPLSETLEDQTNKVNALTLALMDNNLPASERNKIYDELTKLAPEVLAGIDKESISLVQLSKNLAEFNKQAINRIVVARAYEDLQSAQQDAADDAADMVSRQITLNKRLLQTEAELRSIGGDNYKLAVQARKNFESGAINIYDYALAVKRAADAANLYVDAGDRQMGVGEIIKLQMEGLSNDQRDYRVALDETASATNDYNATVKLLGIDISDVTAYTKKDTEVKVENTEVTKEATKAEKEYDDAVKLVFEDLAMADKDSQEWIASMQRMAEADAKAAEAAEKLSEDIEDAFSVSIPSHVDDALAAMALVNKESEIQKIKDNWQGILDQLSGLLVDGITGGNDELANALNQRVDLITKSVDDVSAELDREIELNKQGFASNVQLKRDELQKLKQEQDKAIADRDEQIEKQREQERTAATISATVGAIKLLANAVETGGIAGLITGLLAVGTFIAAISNISSQASGAVQFAQGTAQILGGQSHAGGGVNLGQMGEAEKGEFFGILSAKQTKKYGKPMTSLFDGLNQSNDAKIAAGLLGIAGLSAPEQPGQSNVELKEVKEIKGMYDIMRRPQKSVTHEGNKRIEKTGGHTRIVYVN